jgi:hypothetical protein
VRQELLAFALALAEGASEHDAMRFAAADGAPSRVEVAALLGRQKSA